MRRVGISALTCVTSPTLEMRVRPSATQWSRRTVETAALHCFARRRTNAARREAAMPATKPTTSVPFEGGGEEKVVASPRISYCVTLVVASTSASGKSMGGLV